MIRAIVLIALLLVAAPVAACEMLILAEDRGTTLESWTQGDVVAIHADGVKWGKGEGPPTFWVLTLPGEDVKACEAYAAAVVDADGKMTAIREKRLDYKALPVAAKDSLTRDGVLATTKAGVDASFKPTAVAVKP